MPSCYEEFVSPAKALVTFIAHRVELSYWFHIEDKVKSSHFELSIPCVYIFEEFPRDVEELRGLLKEHFVIMLVNQDVSRAPELSAQLGWKVCSSVDEVREEVRRLLLWGRYPFSDYLKGLIGGEESVLKIPLETYDFFPTHNNSANSLRLTNGVNEVTSKSLEKERNRASFVLKSIQELDSIHLSIRQIVLGMHKEIAYSFYDLAVMTVFFPTTYSEFSSAMTPGSLSRLLQINSERAKGVMKGLLAVQDKEGYRSEVELEGDSYEDVRFLHGRNGFLEGASIRWQKLVTADVMNYFHTSFDLGPYYRTPLVSDGIFRALEYFQPRRFSTTHDYKKFDKEMIKFSVAALAGIGKEIIDYLTTRNGPIFCISDLPLEWVQNERGVPFFVLRDICRVREAEPFLLSRQYHLHSKQPFIISPGIHAKTLVVCMMPSDPVIRGHFEMAKKNCSSEHMPAVNWELCQDGGELVHLIDKHKPEILVIDSHGDFDPKTKESFIITDKGRLTRQDILNHKIFAPIVILSCCNISPVEMGSKPISDAFLVNGTHSLLVSVLPLSILQANLFYPRILKYLYDAVSKPMFDNFLEFLSNALRSLYFDDMFLHALKAFSDDMKHVDNNEHLKSREEWYAGMRNPITREETFLRGKELISNCFKDKGRARRVLDNQRLVPDSYFYTIMGRADLIKFENARVKSVFEHRG